MSSTLNYREDIDGLRAIAVSSVVLYHFGVTGFGGGYVGVDIFFVISGYLIGSIVFAQLGKNKFSFSNFYIRRIRRLFPASFAMTVFSLLLGYWLLLPGDFRELGQSIVASTLYASNVLFYLKAGYFDTASHMKPLLHTWSLSVEEQFYLIFPLAAWLCYRYLRRAMLAVFIFACLASFAAAVIYINHDQSAVFYLYPFRAWEMFLGVVAGMGGWSFGKYGQQRLPSHLIAVTGLVLVCYPILFYTKETQFPGLTALAPCLGTLLLLLSGAQAGNSVTRLLSTAPFVFLGKISYSLYLWHWPIFVFYTYALVREPTFTDSLILILATLAASIFSWKYIEQPFREPATNGNEKRRAFGSTFVASSLCILIGFFIYKADGLPARMDPETARISAVSNDFLRDWTGCLKAENSVLPGLNHCVVGNPYQSKNLLLVWGDSHAAAFRAGIKAAAEQSQQDVLMLWRTGCPPVVGLRKEESANSTQENRECTPHNEKVMEYIQQNENIKAVVLVGRWSYYLNGRGVGTDADHLITLTSLTSAAPDKNTADLFMNAFDNTLKSLQQKNVKLYVMEQVPEFSRYNSSKLARQLQTGTSDAAGAQHLFTESYSDVVARQGSMQNYLADAERAGKVSIVKTHSLFCQADICSLMLNGTPAYFDNNHVTTTASLYMQSLYAPIMRYMATSKASP